MKISRLTSSRMALLLTLPVAALAQPMPDTARALKTLMEGANNGQEQALSMPGGSATMAGQMPAHAGGMAIGHTVRPGETLARVVHQVYGSHPYKDTPVFQLIVQRNPDAFVGGNHNRLRAGAQLNLPHPTELHAALTLQNPQFQMFSGRSAASHDMSGPRSGAVTSPASGKSTYPGPSAAAGQSTSSGDPRRGWIRFP